MKSIILYFKFNSVILLGLTATTVFPLFLIFAYFPRQFPDIQYIFFILLFIIKITLFREKEIKRSLQVKVPHRLKKELKRVPSHKEIYQRIMTVVNGKDITFIVVGLLIFILSVLFKAF